MKFLADESVDLPVYHFLKNTGFDINHVAFINPGIPDAEVLSMALISKSILITVDKDFGELAFRSKSPSYGIILYRLSGLPNQRKAEIVSKAITARLKEIKGSFVVINQRQVRVRKLL